MRYLLYNPLSGKENQAKIDAECYSVVANMSTELVDLTKIKNFGSFLASIDLYDDIVIFGGDGSLNRIANEVAKANIHNDIYYYPSGTGNDFAKDVGMEYSRAPFLITDFIKDLPTVTVNGKQSKFINGVGFGIDGYCCEVGDQLKSTGKQPNYTSIAIKGLLFHFKPVNATVTVDGKKMTFKKGLDSTYDVRSLLRRRYDADTVSKSKCKRQKGLLDALSRFKQAWHSDDLSFHI